MGAAENFMVIDTETVTGRFGLISVGAVVLAREGRRLRCLDEYFGFSDEYNDGYYYAEQLAYAKRNRVKRKSRAVIEGELFQLAAAYGVRRSWAYNASFDRHVVGNYLPTLSFNWRDLMAPARRVLAGEEHLAAYRGVHPYVRISRGNLLCSHYSVDAVGRYLGLPPETHVAIEDARMEVAIGERLGLFDFEEAC